MPKAKAKSRPHPTQEAQQAGIGLLQTQPVLLPLLNACHIHRDTDHQHLGRVGWLVLSAHGEIWLHPSRRAQPAEWARLIATALVCLGLGSVQRREPQTLWELACLLAAEHFCDGLKIGPLPEALWHPPLSLPAGGEAALFQHFRANPPEPTLIAWRDAWSGVDHPLFIELEATRPRWRRCRTRDDWRADFAAGIARGVGVAFQVVAGHQEPGDALHRDTEAQRAKRRLMDAYPLLGALAAGFDLEQDPRQCQHYGIQVAAIDVAARRIWINPAAHLSDAEALFVMAHELLHAGLNHSSRRRGRDPFLWNAACDYVINAWLMEMRVGTPPVLGLLHDPALTDLSAEEIYDRLARDIRRARKLATLRGTGQPDLLGDEQGPPFVDAEAYCRRALAQGMERLFTSGRGTLPAGLIEAIRSLSQPPIPWDVRLAEWFDAQFPPPERQRSYAKPSRRQSATPDIPRPSPRLPPEETRKARVFGVVLDTSGSMAPKLLGQALGAIASYSLAREVEAVRLVSCDAAAFDHGWVPPEALLERYQVRGRGGTVLQPGLDRLRDLAKQSEFPAAGPILLITDGFCEARLDIPFEHAFLLPEGRRLPFTPRAPIFEIR
ncbi:MULTISPECIES: vWA domain-containing protein [Thiorhodovibrio]|uniref:vWA domain-containing protein n=1 Tax=Thiorhodovibrio TaxID=61593 RepID=UPI001911DD5A|nr:MULTISPECIES: hypothetical protein [Thiorhodovibrio]MBK5968360.1 hypothetical protein [Thiorhodovibrio winogradskyi]WPL13191.1 hypothetical protein Thiosp_02985 [Thiorhodovibrio litoralis]